MTFDDWMEEVDELCQLQFGISIHDLPDMLFRHAYDEGLCPKEFLIDNLYDDESLRRLILS